MCGCMLSFFFSCNNTCTISVSTSKHLTFDISTILCFNWNITSWHPLQQRWTIWGDFLNHFDRITHTNKMPAQFLSVCWVYLICADRWCDHFHLFHFISSPICAIWWFNMLLFIRCCAHYGNCFMCAPFVARLNRCNWFSCFVRTIASNAHFYSGSHSPISFHQFSLDHFVALSFHSFSDFYCF